jgi:hypothetical protein
MTHLNAEHRLFIDGALVDAQERHTYEVINPATEEVAGVVAAASLADADRALAAARRCFDESDSGAAGRAFTPPLLRPPRRTLRCVRRRLTVEVRIDGGVMRGLALEPDDVKVFALAPGKRRSGAGERSPAACRFCSRQQLANLNNVKPLAHTRVTRHAPEVRCAESSTRLTSRSMA